MNTVSNFKAGNSRPKKGSFYYDYSLQSYDRLNPVNSSPLYPKLSFSEPVSGSSFKFFFKLGETNALPNNGYHYMIANSEGVSYTGQSNNNSRWNLTGEPYNPFGWIANNGSPKLLYPDNGWIVCEYTIVTPTYHTVKYYNENNPSVLLVDRDYTLVNGSIGSFTLRDLFVATNKAMFIQVKQIQVDNIIWDMNEVEGNKLYASEGGVYLSFNSDFITDFRQPLI